MKVQKPRTLDIRAKRGILQILRMVKNGDCLRILFFCFETFIKERFLFSLKIQFQILKLNLGKPKIRELLFKNMMNV